MNYCHATGQGSFVDCANRTLNCENGLIAEVGHDLGNDLRLAGDFIKTIRSRDSLIVANQRARSHQM
jgi:hypothetical protein